MLTHSAQAAVHLRLFKAAAGKLHILRLNRGAFSNDKINMRTVNLFIGTQNAKEEIFLSGKG
jgi:hypothetical protein